MNTKPTGLDRGSSGSFLVHFHPFLQNKNSDFNQIGTRIVGAEGKIHDHQPYNDNKFIIGLLARLKNFILRKNLLILLHKLLISFGLSGY